VGTRISRSGSAKRSRNASFRSSKACNFQDLTGQRINKVMTTMKFIENHIIVMMDIWGGVDAIKAHAPPIIDEREGDAKLLNGPKLEGDVRSCFAERHRRLVRLSFGSTEFRLSAAAVEHPAV